MMLTNGICNIYYLFIHIHFHIMENNSKYSTFLNKFPPPGYTIISDTSDLAFAVPQFLVPASHSTFDAFRAINSLDNEDFIEVIIILSNTIFSYIFVISRETSVVSLFYKCRNGYGTS